MYVTFNFLHQFRASLPASHKQEHYDVALATTFQDDFRAEFSQNTHLIHEILIFRGISESARNCHVLGCFTKLVVCFVPSPRLGDI